MLGFLHKAITAAAAALLSAGYAVCACLSVAASPVSAHDEHWPAFALAAPHHDAAHRAGGELHGDAIHGAHGDGSPSPVDHSTCKHCALAALAKTAGADDAKAFGGKPGGGMDVALSPARFQPPSSARIMPRQFLRWSAPPDPSPISLKIRLLV